MLCVAVRATTIGECRTSFLTCSATPLPSLTPVATNTLTKEPGDMR